jgi:hypothetical protein
VAVLNGQRKSKDGLTIRNDLSLQKEQYEVMQDAKQLIQDIPGVYATQLGNAPSGVTSGLAINSLVEQGIVAMGELNDNFSTGDRMVNEAIVDLIVEDLSEANMVVNVGTGSLRRQVMLNTRDDQGRPVNMVADAPIKVGLAEVPSSPAYRMQQAQQIATMITSMAGNPQAVSVLAPAYVESSDLPDRKALADDLRRVSGLPMAGDRQGAQQWQQDQQQQAMKTAQVQEASAAADMDKRAAEAQRAAASARLTNAQAARAEIEANQAASPQPGGDASIDDAINEALSQAA